MHEYAWILPPLERDCSEIDRKNQNYFQHVLLNCPIEGPHGNVASAALRKDSFLWELKTDQKLCVYSVHRIGFDKCHQCFI